MTTTNARMVFKSGGRATALLNIIVMIMRYKTTINSGGMPPMVLFIINISAIAMQNSKQQCS